MKFLFQVKNKTGKIRTRLMYTILALVFIFFRCDLLSQEITYPPIKVRFSIEKIQCINSFNTPSRDVENNVNSASTDLVFFRFSGVNLPIPNQPFIPTLNLALPTSYLISEGAVIETRNYKIIGLVTPYYYIENTINNKEFNDVQISFFSKKDTDNEHDYDLGLFKFRIQNNFGYILLDWEKNTPYNIGSPYRGVNFRGKSEVINDIQYLGKSSIVVYKTDYKYYDRERNDDNPEDDLIHNSSYEVTIKIEVVNN